MLKESYVCSNGPWRGHTLYLTPGRTLVMTINGQTGWYAHGYWFSA